MIDNIQTFCAPLQSLLQNIPVAPARRLPALLCAIAAIGAAGVLAARKKALLPNPLAIETPEQTKRRIKTTPSLPDDQRARLNKWATRRGVLRSSGSAESALNYARESISILLDDTLRLQFSIPCDLYYLNPLIIFGEDFNLPAINTDKNELLGPLSRLLRAGISFHRGIFGRASTFSVFLEQIVEREIIEGQTGNIKEILRAIYVERAEVYAKRINLLQTYLNVDHVKASSLVETVLEAKLELIYLYSIMRNPLLYTHVSDFIKPLTDKESKHHKLLPQLMKLSVPAAADFISSQNDLLSDSNGNFPGLHLNPLATTPARQDMENTINSKLKDSFDNPKFSKTMLCLTFVVSAISFACFKSGRFIGFGFDSIRKAAIPPLVSLIATDLVTWFTCIRPALNNPDFEEDDKRTKRRLELENSGKIKEALQAALQSVRFDKATNFRRFCLPADYKGERSPLAEEQNGTRILLVCSKDFRPDLMKPEYMNPVEISKLTGRILNAIVASIIGLAAVAFSFHRGILGTRAALLATAGGIVGTCLLRNGKVVGIKQVLEARYAECAERYAKSTKELAGCEKENDDNFNNNLLKLYESKVDLVLWEMLLRNPAEQFSYNDLYHMLNDKDELRLRVQHLPVADAADAIIKYRMRGLA